MKNSHYFGLMWILSANTAAVVSNGAMRGVFILTSAVSLGLAMYALVKEYGLLNDSSRSDSSEPAAARVAARVRERSARSAEARRPEPEADAVFVAHPSSVYERPAPAYERVITEVDLADRPEPSSSERPSERREPQRAAWPISGIIPKRDGRRLATPVESPLSWFLRALGRGR